MGVKLGLLQKEEEHSFLGQSAEEVGAKLHNEEFLNLFSSPSIIRMIKSRRMRWSGSVALMEDECA
jgi:hypothetical protein